MITLEYPYGSPTVSVTLPNPELQDSHTRELPIKIYRTVSGKVYTYKAGPRNDLLLMRFNKLKATERDALQAWIQYSYDYEIKLTDWLTRIWRGHVITNPIEFTSVHTDRYSTTIEFSGLIQ